MSTTIHAKWRVQNLREERQTLLRGLVQIICVSNFIRDCFLDGLNPEKCDLKKIQNLNCGVARRLTSRPVKEPIIFIAGRMVPEKGILEAALAIADILPFYPEWKLVIAGARRFKDAPAGSYEAKVGKAIAPLGGQAEMLGFIPPDAVRLWQERAAIAACPSIWQEPLGKVVVEALAGGCAVLTTRCGGIPEVAEGRALIIDNPTVSAFCDGFNALLSDQDFRRDLQMRAWNDFPFTSAAMANKVDILRKGVITSLRLASLFEKRIACGYCHVEANVKKGYDLGLVTIYRLFTLIALSAFGNHFVIRSKWLRQAHRLCG